MAKKTFNYKKTKAIRQREKQSKHFHTSEKGCEIIPKILFVWHGESKSQLQGGYCNTHKKDICRCGWEFGYHYGTNSKLLF